jgi:hypothetical protein
MGREILAFCQVIFNIEPTKKYSAHFDQQEGDVVYENR